MSKRPTENTEEQTFSKRQCQEENSSTQPFTSLQQNLGTEDKATEPSATSTSHIEVQSRDWQINCNLNQCLLNVYDNHRWSDMVIRCGDKSVTRPLKAHKLILAARSPVFEAMLFGPCCEPKVEYDFPDDDVDIFDLMLRFMYNDDVELTYVDDAISLLAMGHLYQFIKLVDHCGLYLGDTITVNNVCPSLDCGVQYDVKQLREACCDFIDRHVAQVLRSDEFLALSQKGLAYILKGDTSFEDEDTLFNRVKEWATLKLSEQEKEIYGQNVREILGKAFYYNRLSTLKPQTLIKCIKGKGYFSIEEQEDIIDFSLGGKSQPNVLSNISRVPIEECITVTRDLNEHGRSSRTQKQKLKQMLTIEVKKDILVTSILIPVFETSFLFSSEKLFIGKGEKKIPWFTFS